MEAIILAGGFGTRLRSVVPDLPKPMAPICGRPFLEILLASLARKGFGRIVLSVGYMAEKVVSHFGSSFAGIDLVYEIEELPLGTGGATRLALTRCSSDHVFVFNGDTYIDLEIEHIESYWQEHLVPIVVAREVPNTSRYGRITTHLGRISSFAEKGVRGPGLINAGCYVLPTRILDQLARSHRFSLEVDFLPKAVKKQRFDVFVTKRDFIDIGVPEDYARAQIALAGILS